MKAIILLATLKKEIQSNTQVLSEFFAGYLQKQNVEVEIIKLVDYNILPGTHLNMGEGDDWPGIFEKIKAAQIILLATPVWWAGHSSRIQIVFERLDDIYNEMEEGKESQLAGKAGGVIVTGEIDGGQHVVGNVANFYNSVGILFPPQTALTVIWDGHTKGEPKPKEELLIKYREEYGQAAETMAQNLVKYL